MKLKATPGPSAATLERRAQIAAFDEMCAARPLRPPPCDFAARARSAAALALQADRRAGVW